MMQGKVMVRRQEVAFVNTYFTEAKCAKCAYHLLHDTSGQENGLTEVIYI